MAKTSLLHGVGVRFVNDLPLNSTQHQMWRSIESKFLPKK